MRGLNSLKHARWRARLLSVLPIVASMSALLIPTRGIADTTFTTLYDFTGSFDSSGGGPEGGLLIGADGSLYGTAGNVFKLTPPTTPGGNWTETVLSSVGYGRGVISDPSGALYGAIPFGGNGLCYNGFNLIGCGTVFKLTPPTTPNGSWTETVLYAFLGGSDGADPDSSLVIDASGTLYGTTSAGGGVKGCFQGNCGTVFKLTPPSLPGSPWTETVLYRFQGGSDGDTPLGSLIFDGSGALYGTTALGGRGTVFKLTPPTTPGHNWTETVLHTFMGGPDGSEPEGKLVFDGSGALYGTTNPGGTAGFGTVFQLAPPPAGGNVWTKNTLYSFSRLLKKSLPIWRAVLPWGGEWGRRCAAMIRFADTFQLHRPGGSGLGGSPAARDSRDRERGPGGAVG